MTFWLINLESDVMLGFIAYSQKLSLATLLIFWLINILTFIIQQPYLIASIFTYETFGSVIAVYTLIGVSQYILLKQRVRTQGHQISPEEQLTPQKTGQLTMKSPLRTTITSFSHRKQMRLLPLTYNFQKRYFKWLLYFTSILILHSLLFIHQMTSLLSLKASISLHIVLLTELFSSVLINLFIIISIGNLLINLYFQDIFVKYYENNAFSTAYQNLLTNCTEIYIFSFNLALIMSSIVGILFVQDLASEVLFYFYLSLFGMAFLYNLYHKIKANEY